MQYDPWQPWPAVSHLLPAGMVTLGSLRSQHHQKSELVLTTDRLCCRLCLYSVHRVHWAERQDSLVVIVVFVFNV